MNEKQFCQNLIDFFAVSDSDAKPRLIPDQIEKFVSEAERIFNMEEDVDISENHLLSWFKNSADTRTLDVLLQDEYEEYINPDISDNIYSYASREIANAVGISIDKTENILLEMNEQYLLSPSITYNPNTEYRVNILFPDNDYDWRVQRLALGEEETPTPEWGRGSLNWLAKTQGYNLSDLAEPEDSKFLASLINELDEARCDAAVLCFCVRMKPGDFQKLKNGEPLVIKTTCGLYEPSSGNGGSMEIELEKPVAITRDMIDCIQIEPNGIHSQEIDNDGYTVDYTYGMTNQVWQKPLADTVEVIKTSELTPEQCQKLAKFEAKETLKVS